MRVHFYHFRSLAMIIAKFFYLVYLPPFNPSHTGRVRVGIQGILYCSLYAQL